MSIREATHAFWKYFYFLYLRLHIKTLPQITHQVKKIPRICFFSPDSYPYFNPDVNCHFNDTDKLIYTISKELSRNGKFHISIIVADNNQPRLEIKDGVHLVSISNHTYCRNKKYDPSEIARLAISSSPESIINEIDSAITRDLQFKKNNKAFYKKNEILYVGKNNLKQKTITYFGIKNFKTISLLLYEFLDIFNYIRSQIPIFSKLLKQLSSRIFTERNFTLSNIIKKRLDLWSVIPGRSNFPIWKNDIRIYDQIDADIYVIRSRDSEMAAITAKYCKIKNKKFVVISKNNSTSSASNYLEDYALKSSDLHIVETQNPLLLGENSNSSDKFYIASVSDVSVTNQNNYSSKNILWIGELKHEPTTSQALFSIARQFPANLLIMVVTDYDLVEFKKFFEIAKFLPNIKIQFLTSINNIRTHIENSLILLNTSSTESYSDFTFEALTHGIPVVYLSRNVVSDDTKESAIHYSNDSLNEVLFYIRNIIENSRSSHLYTTNPPSNFSIKIELLEKTFYNLHNFRQTWF